jgi:DUF4097 and DUF4098 domain-containing protein YvlB
VPSRSERFPTGTARLRVRNPSGEVHVDARDGEEATVELVPLNDSDATAEAIRKATVAQHGDELVVEVDTGRSWSISIGSLSFGSAKVAVKVTCPTGCALALDTASADVRVEGTVGATRVRTASGDLRLGRVEGALEVKTASGDLEIGHVEGRATVHTVSGDLELHAARNGLAVNSVSGDVLVDDVLGELEIGTVSGDATVRAAGPGEISVKAVSGDVDVAVRRGLRVRLDVNSLSGTIGSELEVSDAPGRGDGPQTSLRVRTVSGDVRIARAVEAVA